MICVLKRTGGWGVWTAEPRKIVMLGWDLGLVLCAPPARLQADVTAKAVRCAPGGLLLKKYAQQTMASLVTDKGNRYKEARRR